MTETETEKDRDRERHTITLTETKTDRDRQRRATERACENDRLAQVFEHERQRACGVGDLVEGSPHDNPVVPGEIRLD